MRDEEYEFYEDCRDKKRTANSAFKKRTHTGKGGRVRLPSDNLSKKELQKMNGEIKSYRMNEPMSWAEFKAMPDDVKIMYIKLLREKYNVPGRRISDMMGCDAGMFARELRRLGINDGKRRSRSVPWDEEGWYEWSGAERKVKKKAAHKAHNEVQAQVVEPEVSKEVEVENSNEPAVMELVEETALQKKAVPISGNMIFEGMADDVLETMRVLLGGAKVQISITWDVLSEEG